MLLGAHLGDAAAHRTGAQLDANGLRAEAGKELVAPERQVPDGSIEDPGHRGLGEHVEHHQLYLADQERAQRFGHRTRGLLAPLEGQEEASHRRGTTRRLRLPGRRRQACSPARAPAARC